MVDMSCFGFFFFLFIWFILKSYSCEGGSLISSPVVGNAVGAVRDGGGG